MSEAAGAVGTGAHSGMRVSIVHQAKGEEADAVLVILPDEDRTHRLVDAWISGTHDADVAESLRVVYVAATRARRLLAIAVPETDHAKIVAHLESMNVPLIPEQQPAA